MFQQLPIGTSMAIQPDANPLPLVVAFTDESKWTCGLHVGYGLECFDGRLLVADGVQQFSMPVPCNPPYEDKFSC